MPIQKDISDFELIHKQELIAYEKEYINLLNQETYKNAMLHITPNYESFVNQFFQDSLSQWNDVRFEQSSLIFKNDDVINPERYDVFTNLGFQVELNAVVNDHALEHSDSLLFWLENKKLLDLRNINTLEFNDE